MAVTFLGEVGSASNKTSGTSLAVTNTSASVIPAGTLLLMVVGYDNHASLTAATVTASNTGGATWTQRLGPIGSGITTSAGAGIWDVTFSARTVSDIAVGGTLTTLTFSNAVVAKLAVIVGLRGVQEVLRGTSTSGTSTSGVPTVTTGGTAPVAGDIVIGTASFETSATPGSDTDTSNGSWSTAVTKITTGGGAANTNIAQIVQYKIVTAGGHQTYNPTGANDSIVSVRAFLPEPDPTVTQAAYRLYADGTESGSTALAAQDTAPTIDLSSGDVPVQVRVREQSTNATNLDATDDWQLQWEKNASGSWTDVTAPLTVVDEYAFANGDGSGQALISAQTSQAQAFTGDGRLLGRVIFSVWGEGTPTGTLTAQLWAHDAGTFGSGGKPTGAALATSTTVVAVSTLPIGVGNRVQTSFIFDGSFTLVAGTKYFIGLTLAGGSASPNFVRVERNATGTGHPGNGSYFAPSVWTATVADLVFQVWPPGTPGASTVLPYASANLTALVDSYPSANSSSTLGLQVGSVAVTACQSFLGDGGRLTQAGFYASSTGTSNGTVTAVLYAHTGTFGTGTPTGSPLATSTSVDTVTLGTLGWKYFTFDGTFTLTPGTAYCIGLTTTNTTFAACTLRTDSTTPTHAGSASRYSTSWIAIADDLLFEVYTAGDGAPTTNRLTGGTGTFTAGKISETGLVTDLGWSGNNYTELVYSVTLKAADLANSDTLRFRVLRNGATTGLTYTAVPTINVTLAAGLAPVNAQDPVGITDSRGLGVDKAAQDPVGITDSSAKTISIDRQDSVGLTDSVTTARVIDLDVSDVASALFDGGGNNLLGIDSSFEFDTNADGIADGWRVPTGAELTPFQAPNSWSRSGPLGPTGHGSWCQQIVKSIGSLHGVFFGPAVVAPKGSYTLSAVVLNPTGSAVDIFMGVATYLSNGTYQGYGSATTTVPASTTMQVTYTFPPSDYQDVRPVIGVDGSSNGVVYFDKVNFRPGTAARTEAQYDYYDPANRISLTTGPLTLDRQDSVGLTDSVSATIFGGYDAAVATDGANHYWKLSEATGIAPVDSLGGLTTTQTITSAPKIAPNLGTSAIFTGAGVSGFTAPATLSAPYTVECWVRPTSNNDQSIFNTGTFLFNLVPYYNAGFMADIGTGSTWLSTAMDTSGNNPAGQPRHVVLTVTSSTALMYVDGVQVASQPLSGGTPRLYDPAKAITIGGGYLGAVSNIATYPSVLTQPQIAYHFLLAGKDVQDRVGVTDSQAIVTSPARSDTEALTDSRALALDLSRSDNVALTDSMTVAISRAIDVSDRAGITDSAVAALSAISLSDTVGITDSVSVAIAGGVSLVDPVGLTDTFSIEAVLTRSDTEALTDTRALDISIPRSDTVNLTDARAVTTSKSVQDPVGLTDSWATPLLLGRDYTDQVTVTDAVARAADYRRDTQDAVGITDAASLGIAGSLDTQNLVGLTDSISTVLDAVRSDTENLTDSVAVVANRVTTFSDTENLTDSVAVALARAIDLSDTEGITDTQSRVASYVRDYQDVAGIADTANTSGSGAANTQDPVGVTDTDSFSLIATRSDNVPITDTVLAAADRAFAKQDAIGITDSILVEVSRALSVQDPVGITDSVSRLIDYTRSYQDPVNITDAATQSGSGAVGAQDRAGITDSDSQALDATRQDTVGLTDSVGTERGITRQDSVGITDSYLVELSRALSYQNPVTVTDTWAISLTKSRSDSAGITDSHTIDFAGLKVLDTQNLVGLTDARAISVQTALTDLVMLTDSMTHQLVSVGGQPQVWDGSTWQSRPAMVYDTSSGTWAERQVKVYDSGAWVPIP